MKPVQRQRVQRIAVGIEYDGNAFVGWQRQDSGRSVQAALENALSRIADEPISVVGAGRTDAGVHALMQVAHFQTSRTRSTHNWILGSNRYLPPDMALHWAQTVPEDFHARFSALARCYRYAIHESRVRPVLTRKRCAWVVGQLDLAAMQAAANCLQGEHDFSAFRAAGCQARSAHRNLSRIDLWREPARLCVEVEANAFLQHMVRNLVGSLVLVGQGRKRPAWMGEVLASRDRRQAGPAAPPQGLTLLGVTYPEHFGLPAHNDAMHSASALPASAGKRRVRGRFLI